MDDTRAPAIEVQDLQYAWPGKPVLLQIKHFRIARGERAGFFYSRMSNPGTRQLELLLAELQGRQDCLTCASGINAVAQVLLALTRQGDHVVSFVEGYGPTRQLLRGLLTRFGVAHTLLPLEDHEGLAAVLASRPTRLVFFESPTTPAGKIADVGVITSLAHRFGALAVLDNTLAVQGDVINLPRSGYPQAVLACMSVQNGFWLFDQREMALLRVDASLRPLANTGRLDQLLGFPVAQEIPEPALVEVGAEPVPGRDTPQESRGSYCHQTRRS